jgi:hypothetical protein
MERNFVTHFFDNRLMPDIDAQGLAETDECIALPGQGRGRVKWGSCTLSGLSVRAGILWRSCFG